MRSLFVMDPLHTLSVRGDSTYVTMRASTDRGDQVHWCTPDQLWADSGAAFARCQAVRTTRDAPYFHVGTAEDKPLADFDVIWMRKDPPFDMRYIFTTYLLDMAPKSTLVVNDAHGLKLFNEKMWVLQQWPELHPRTIVANSLSRLRDFIEATDEPTVIKPWDGNGGRGVLITQRGDRNLSSMLEVLTQNGTDYVIAQAYLPGVRDGDKRILLFDGEPVGAILRVPNDGDHRANMHAGGSVQATDLDARDAAICAAIGPLLKQHGQTFVGIDVIDGYLTEINVTSPTGLQEVNRLYGKTLEVDLVNTVEGLLHRKRTA